ncbi:MAG: DUF6044 family protein [Bacteroidota bacterium]
MRPTHKTIILFLSFIFLTAYLSPYIFFLSKAQILIHDNLDSMVLMHKILAESGKIFSSNNFPIPAVMNGVPRIALGSGFNMIVLLYYLFPTQIAYSINIILIHLIAFIGMYLFARKYFFLHHKDELLICGISLSYALLPFWPSAGLSIAGLPLLLFALINIYKKDERWYNWIIIFLFPFYSNLFFSSLFFIPLLLIFPLYYVYENKTIHWKFIIAITLLTIMYLAVEYRMIANYLIGDFVTHRVEMEKAGMLNLKGVIGTSLLHFIFGQYHAESMHFPIIMFLGAVGIFFSKDKFRKNIILLLICLAFLISLSYKIIDWTALDGLKNKIHFLNYFQIRFYTIFPLLWYCILGLSVASLLERIKYKFILYIFIFLQIGFNIIGTNNNEENAFINTFITSGKNDYYASFDDYFQPVFFNQIKKSITEDPKSFNVLCVGFVPAIAQYNGIQTLDGYLSFYSLEYKRKFRKIIQCELEKNEFYRLYFDKWGSRCYVFLSEHPKNNVISQLSIDTKELKQMNCKYIFSQFIIKNYKELNLTLHEKFTSENNNANLKTLFIYKLL